MILSENRLPLFGIMLQRLDMRAETIRLVDDIKQSIELLRRHL